MIVLNGRNVPVPICRRWHILPVFIWLLPVDHRLTPISHSDGALVARDDGEEVLDGIVLADKPDSSGEDGRENENKEGEKSNNDGSDGHHSEGL